MSEAKQFNVVVGDDLITFETGRLAGLAGGAVVIRQDDNMMLAVLVGFQVIGQVVNTVGENCDLDFG